MIAKLDEDNNLNEKFKNQISSQVDKIKSLEEQLVESKTEVEKLTSAKLLVEPNSKEFFILFLFFFIFLHLKGIMKSWMLILLG